MKSGNNNLNKNNYKLNHLNSLYLGIQPSLRDEKLTKLPADDLTNTFSVGLRGM